MPGGKPNIVYIMADDLGYGDLGCYGAVKIKTPCADRIAAEGMRFLDAHSSSAVCTPSRYSVLTGRYCWRTPLKKWVMQGLGGPLIELGRPTIASFLKENGYHTCAVGKWHVGLKWPLKDGVDEEMVCKKNKHGHVMDLDPWMVDYSKKIEHTPNDLGFDYFFGIPGSLDMYPYCFVENDHTVGIPSVPKHPRYNQQRAGPMVPGWKDEEVDIKHAEKAVEFIENHVKSRPNDPFFLYLATSAPHRPCDCQPELVRGKSEAGDRGDMVMLFDWVVGQVDDALRKYGLVDDTIVFITSDNGARLKCANGLDYGHKSCGNLRGQKADIWDGGHREPFVVRWPGHVKPGSTCDDLICLVDMFATFADLLGKPLPDGYAEDSISFLPSMLGSSGENPGGRKVLVHHSGGGMFSVRKGRWKLVKGLGSGGFSHPRHVRPMPWGPKGQLYDMENDVAETNNLWKKRKDVVEELLAELEKATTSPKTR